MGTSTAGGRKPETYARRLFHNQVLQLARLEQHGWLTTLFTKKLDLTNNQVLKRIQMSSCCRLELTEIHAFGSVILHLEGVKHWQGAVLEIRTHCKN